MLKTNKISKFELKKSLEIIINIFKSKLKKSLIISKTLIFTESATILRSFGISINNNNN